MHRFVGYRYAFVLAFDIELITRLNVVDFICRSKDTVWSQYKLVTHPACLGWINFLCHICNVEEADTVTMVTSLLGLSLLDSALMWRFIMMLILQIQLNVYNSCAHFCVCINEQMFDLFS